MLYVQKKTLHPSGQKREDVAETRDEFRKRFLTRILWDGLEIAVMDHKKLNCYNLLPALLQFYNHITILIAFLVPVFFYKQYF